MDVVVKLMGGLGNQLFQYAAGRSLSLRFNATLWLDTSLIHADSGENYTKRPFELDAFHIQGHIAGIEQIRPFLRFPRNRYTLAVQRAWPSLFSHVYFWEKDLGYIPSFEKIKGNAYLQGYWQSEHYFKNIEAILREDLEFKGPVPSVCESWLQKIRTTNSISLHIRRGDYVNQANNSLYAQCPPSYYEQAVSYMRQRIPDLQVFVFSDDISWCEKNLVLSVPCQYVRMNEVSNYWDMYLMSHCRHHIIANSSFSWWGAWLNTDPGKIVIAPKVWYSQSDKNTNDLIPHAWIRL